MTFKSNYFYSPLRFNNGDKLEEGNPAKNKPDEAPALLRNYKKKPANNFSYVK
jgi:hypothetical protein